MKRKKKIMKSENSTPDIMKSENSMPEFKKGRGRPRKTTFSRRSENLENPANQIPENTLLLQDQNHKTTKSKTLKETSDFPDTKPRSILPQENASNTLANEEISTKYKVDFSDFTDSFNEILDMTEKESFEFAEESVKKKNKYTVVEVTGDPCTCAIENCLNVERLLLRMTSGSDLEPSRGWLSNDQLEPAGRFKPPLNLSSLGQKIPSSLVLSYLKFDLMYTPLENWLLRFLEANVRYGKEAGLKGTLFLFLFKKSQIFGEGRMKPFST